MENSKPQRIQRRRTAGWRMPDGAVYVGRPTRWGNPFKVGEVVTPDLMPHLRMHLTLTGNDPNLLRGMKNVRLMAAADVVPLYELWLVEQPHLMVSLGDLRGHDLVCWCPPGPCHADVLLELANGEAL